MRVLFSVYLLFSLLTLPVEAKLLVKPEEALKKAFPGSISIEKKNILLNPSEAKRAQKLAQEKIEDRVFTFYVVKKDEKILSYAGLHTRSVRTKDETSLFLISPKGRLQNIEVIAFYEPPEYIPNEPWLKEFSGKSLKDPLKRNNDIPNLTGATLSAQALTESARMMLAVWNVKFATPAESDTTETKNK